MDEVVVFEGVHHEQREIDAARQIAFEDGITQVPTPNRQAARESQTL
jgi:hypothetical protein